MTKRDATMLALYLIVIAMGAVMMEREPVLGTIQIVLGAAVFGYRMYWISNRR